MDKKKLFDGFKAWRDEEGDIADVYYRFSSGDRLVSPDDLNLLLVITQDDEGFYRAWLVGDNEPHIWCNKYEEKSIKKVALSAYNTVIEMFSGILNNEDEVLCRLNSIEDICTINGDEFHIKSGLKHWAYDNPNFKGEIREYTLPDGGASIPHDTTVYVIVSCHCGIPSYEMTVNPAGINGSDIILFFTAHYDSKAKEMYIIPFK